MTELEQFEKYASDTYESIERYETLPTKPYKSLEVEAAHDAWMARASFNFDAWINISERRPEYADSDDCSMIFAIWYNDGEVTLIEYDFVSLNSDKFTHWMPKPKATLPNPPEDK